MIEVATLFTGVNAGYQGDRFAITTPVEAASIVQDLLKVIENTLPFHNEYVVCPAVAVYHTTRGCLEGGEPVGAIKLAGCIGPILKMAKLLRERLNQTTLSICAHRQQCGVKTRGFVVSVTGDIREIGRHWQKAAAAHAQKHGGEISCGIYAQNSDRVVIQADANPFKMEDIFQWECAANEIIHDVGYRLGQPVVPEFRNAWFTYLRKAET